MKKLIPQRFIVGVCIAYSIALDSSAERALPGQAMWRQSSLVELLTWASVLLSLIAMLLLWRYRRAHEALAGEQEAHADERALRASAEQALLATHANLCRLVAQQDGLKEAERRRIGADIHDDLGQHLLTLKIDISMLQMSTAGVHPLIHQKLAMISRNLDLTIRSLRYIINDLRPAGLDAGLQPALEWQVSEFTRVNNIPCRLDTGDGAFNSCGPLDTVVFRILQEALSNIARHARASEVRIVLRRDAARLNLTVSDDGVGIPERTGPCRNGCGLPGMRERIAHAGGELSIDSGPGRGTTLSASLPLAAA